MLVMAIRLEDGRVKRAFVKAYFYFFTATFASVIMEHMYVNQTASQMPPR